MEESLHGLDLKDPDGAEHGRESSFSEARAHSCGQPFPQPAQRESDSPRPACTPQGGQTCHGTSCGREPGKSGKVREMENWRYSDIGDWDKSKAGVGKYNVEGNHFYCLPGVISIL